MKCEDCKYWELFSKHKKEGKTSEGFCHRYAPRIVEGMMAIGDESVAEITDDDSYYSSRKYPHEWDCQRAIWPKIRGEEWCGEFEPKAESGE